MDVDLTNLDGEKLGGEKQEKFFKRERESKLFKKILLSIMKNLGTFVYAFSHSMPENRMLKSKLDLGHIIGLINH